MNITLKKKAGLLLLAVLTLAACNRTAQQSPASAAGNDSTAMASHQTVKTLQAGPIAITWIQDNAADKLMPRNLFADAPDSLIDRLGLQEGIPSTISVFLIETEGLRILFDTGLGAPDSRLLSGLKAKGLTPSDIDYVYLTHFHGDHIGGLLSADSALFTHAEVYAAQAEYDAWMKRPAKQKAQVAKTCEAYREHLHLFDFGTTLPGNVQTQAAAGHTPGHTVYQIGPYLIVGDLMHGAALQLPYPQYCAAFDENKQQAIETRKRVLEYARTNHLTIAGMHLPAPAFLTPEQQ